MANNHLKILLLLIAFPFFGNSQSTIIENYIDKGLNNNLSLKQEQLSLEKSIESLREAKGLFHPQVGFNSTYSVAKGGRSIDFPAGDLLNPVYTTLNQLTQSNQFPSNIENVNEQLLPHNFQDTKVRILQPIFNKNIQYNYKIKEALIGTKEAAKAVYQQELIKNIKVAYYQYLQTLDLLDIHEETRNLIKEILRVNQKLVKNQKATKEIIYSAEYELSKLQTEFAEANKNKKIAQAYFNFLLNKDLESPIEVDSTIQQQDILLPNVILPVDKTAIQNRQELTQLQSVLTTNEQVTLLHKASRLPTLNLVADVGFQGFGYDVFDGQAYAFGQVSLQWDIYNGRQKQSKIAQSNIESDILATQYLELQQQLILQAKTAYYEQLAAYENIRSSQSALKSAAAYFNVIQKKHQQGQAFFYELIAAQTQFFQAKIGVSLAKFGYLIEVAEWERAVAK